MSGPSRYLSEQKAKAVRMVFEAAPNYPSQWAAIESVADKVGVSSESLRKWVRQAEVDGGQRAGATTEEAAEIKRLRREVAELRGANEILKAAAALFGAELDRKPATTFTPRTSPRPVPNESSLYRTQGGSPSDFTVAGGSAARRGHDADRRQLLGRKLPSSWRTAPRAESPLATARRSAH